jgi:TetR/AcrR family transcriptional regulator, transcriptional repressor for nem operon
MPTSSNPPRTARGRATRERIVQAAAELVAERGVAGTSLDDVRERAHASKSQLYLYFADREELLRGVATATSDTVIESQAQALAEFDSLAGIERYLDGIVAMQVERHASGGCPIGSLAGQLAEQDDRARVILADGLGRWETGLQDGLEAMAARGELRHNADPALLATQTLALLQGGLLLTQVRRDAGQMRIVADTILTLVREALPESHPAPPASPAKL